MSAANKKLEVTKLTLGTAITGLAIGWLVGLSVSPVIHVIIAGLLSMAATYLSIGLSIEPEESKANFSRFAPSAHGATRLAILTVAMAFGVPVGIFVRSNDLLGMQPDRVIAKWKDPKLDDTDARSYLFKSVYGSAGKRETEEKKELEPAGEGPKPFGGFAYAGPGQSASIVHLLATPDDQLIGELSLSNDKFMQALGRDFRKEPETIRRVLTIVQESEHDHS